jgi:hypothetical protein
MILNVNCPNQICGEYNEFTEAKMTDTSAWKKIGPFSGSIVAEMVAEVLKDKNIPHIVKNNWLTAAYGANSFNSANESSFILVAPEYYETALEISQSIAGDFNATFPEHPDGDEI